MMINCYIDRENMTNIKTLKKKKNVRYVVFLGKNQEPDIKYEKGTKVKILRCEKQGKQFLDCKLIHYFLQRYNDKNTRHIVVSKDKGYDKFIDYVNTSKGKISKRIENLERIDNLRST